MKAPLEAVLGTSYSFLPQKDMLAGINAPYITLQTARRAPRDATDSCPSWITIQDELCSIGVISRWWK
ncbi:hypothetical protein H6P81_015600 [Aristolochia fimbriata]|uniref:Uncharacterized protein n=1 Tax=Aristolochia fimbriata TaxID=158543 RepID=A0AAV7E5Z5_ARIFI|nr:hypothetical protein H6P81_015600 [Aristolochia fimbriata]